MNHRWGQVLQYDNLILLHTLSYLVGPSQLTAIKSEYCKKKPKLGLSRLLKNND